MALLAPSNRFLPRVVLLSLAAALVAAACQVPDLVGNFGIDASLGGGGTGPTSGTTTTSSSSHSAAGTGGAKGTGGAAGTGGAPDGG